MKIEFEGLEYLKQKVAIEEEIEELEGKIYELHQRLSFLESEARGEEW